MLYTLVFLSDLCIAFFSAKFYYALEARHRVHAVAWGLVLDLVINLNVIGVAELKWKMIPVSMLGGALGTFSSMGLPRKNKSVS